MLTLILGLGNIGKKYDKTRHNLGFEVVDRVIEKLGAVRQEDGECYQWWKGEVESQDGQAGCLPRTEEEGLLRPGEAPDTRNDNVSGVSIDGQTGASAAHEDGPGSCRAAHEQSVSDRGSHSKLWATRVGTLRQAQGEVEKGAQIERGKRIVYLAKPTTYMNGSGEAAKELIERLGITPSEILVIIDDFQIPLGAVRFRPNGSDGGHNGLVSVIEELGTQAFPRLRLGIGLPQEQGRAGRMPAAHKKDQAQIIDYVLTKFTPDEKPAVEKMLAIASEGVIFALQHRLEKVMSKYNFNPAPENLA